MKTKFIMLFMGAVALASLTGCLVHDEPAQGGYYGEYGHENGYGYHHDGRWNHDHDWDRDHHEYPR